MVKEVIFEQIFCIYNFILKQIFTFVFADKIYFFYMILAVGLYFILKYFVKNKIYKVNKEKRKSVIFNMQIVTLTVIIGSFLEIYGFHNKQIIYLFACVSIVLVAYNIGSWGIFQKMATVIDTKKIVKDEDLVKKLNIYVEEKSIQALVDFEFNNKKYFYKGGDKNEFREYGILLQTNKTTRLYDMFLALAIFFFALLFLAYVFDSFISKDSMVYGVLLLFGASFILPYLQDVKNTIRFANNKYLAFGTFASFVSNGKEYFGEIIDMNLYEIILKNHWDNTKIVISHSEIKTIVVYDKGRLFSFLYIVSKNIKYRLYNVLEKWIKEYDESKDESVLNVSSFKQFFKTKDDDHGLQFFVFIKQGALENYALIVNEIEHYIQKKSDAENLDLCTPKRVDLKIINPDYITEGGE